ncbi:MAG: tRNA (adenosine(37)-N6)-threonylcarbamoyltransferase complex ATPase subunit type 1 TsaE [Turicibacter sp.]|nr:tRNA (adenosine(37)-N6)-threonylcarbamoyltransferase complex ATPase subunit type 1 TsaE [Turicibacter sp.]
MDVIKLGSVSETMGLAQKIGECLMPGMVLTLEGDLGAGKTTFTKGLAKGLDIKGTVNSPTFTIIKEYDEGVLPLYHMDAYRLENGYGDMGLDDYFYGDGICVIEWASLIEPILPPERLEVKIFNEGETGRRFEFIPRGEDYEFISEVLEYVRAGH